MANPLPSMGSTACPLGQRGDRVKSGKMEGTKVRGTIECEPS